MNWTDAYQEMKTGNVVCRTVIPTTRDTMKSFRKLRIIKNKFREWSEYYDWNTAVQISIEDLDAIDWEVVAMNTGCKNCKYRLIKCRNFTPECRRPQVSYCGYKDFKIGKRVTVYVKDNTTPDWCPMNEVEE